MTSSHHAPYVQGFTHATMARTEGCKTVRLSESLKAGLSSDWGLQLDPMKSESLVIADQQRCGEYVPGRAHTARYVMKVGNTRSRWPTLVGGAVEGGIGDWDEVVTR